MNDRASQARGVYMSKNCKSIICKVYADNGCKLDELCLIYASETAAGAIQDERHASEGEYYIHTRTTHGARICRGLF